MLAETSTQVKGEFPNLLQKRISGQATVKQSWTYLGRHIILKNIDVSMRVNRKTGVERKKGLSSARQHSIVGTHLALFIPSFTDGYPG